MQSSDVIVIGGGVNGLAAAGRLAQSGREVIVVEAAAKMGGGAETCEFHKGYWVSGLAHLLTQLDPRMEKELDLARHGLSFAAANLKSTALSCDGQHLVVSGPHVDGLNDADCKAWTTLCEQLTRYADVLRPLKHMPPPRLANASGNELVKLAKLGLSMRRMGQNKLREMLRLLLINVADVLDDEINDDRLKGLVAFDSILGSHLGPRSPNSLILLLHRLSGSPLTIPKGGMGSVAEALVRALNALRVEMRTSTPVKSLVVVGDEVTGVELGSGEVLRAPVVLSAINPRTTLLGLLGPRHLDTDCVRRIAHIRMRGSAVKLNLALKGKPDFLGADLRSRLVIAPSIDAVETAFNACKYGEFSPKPVMEIILPSAFEPDVAPPGHHVLSIVAQYAPTELKEGWKTGRPKLLRALLSRLAEYEPGIEKQIVASELLTPPDIEQRYGLLGGNWHHGELAVEQMLFLRPTPDTARYATPVAGLYLGGGGSHPGGGISGAAGWNAANFIMQEHR